MNLKRFIIGAALLGLAACWTGAAPNVAAQSRDIGTISRSEDQFRVRFPSRRDYSGNGQIIFVTAIGPMPGTVVEGATFIVNWASDGTTPASELQIEVEMPIDDTMKSVVVTGADLGFGDGRGVFRGQLPTSAFNGTVWKNSFFDHSVVDITIGRVGGGPIDGTSFFIRSAVVLDTVPPGPQVFVEDFEDGNNEAGWSWGTGNEFLKFDGGHPDTFLMDDFVVSSGPGASTFPGVESEFTGNYFERSVSSVGIDLKTFNVSGNIKARMLSVLLINANGTPFDFDDDWGAFFIGDKPVPQVIAGPDGNNGWEEYEFDIPFDSRRVPDGWETFGTFASWRDLMSDVSELMFYYGDPSVPQLFLTWSVGMDNPRITEQP
jgi:hypothetical protein